MLRWILGRCVWLDDDCYTARQLILPSALWRRTPFDADSDAPQLNRQELRDDFAMKYVRGRAGTSQNHLTTPKGLMIYPLSLKPTKMRVDVAM